MGVTSYQTYLAYKKTIKAYLDRKEHTKVQIAVQTNQKYTVVNRVINDLEFCKILKITAYSIFIDDKIIKCKKYKMVDNYDASL